MTDVMIDGEMTVGTIVVEMIVMVAGTIVAIRVMIGEEIEVDHHEESHIIGIAIVMAVAIGETIVTIDDVITIDTMIGVTVDVVIGVMVAVMTGATVISNKNDTTIVVGLVTMMIVADTIMGMTIGDMVDITVDMITAKEAVLIMMIEDIQSMNQVTIDISPIPSEMCPDVINC